MGTMKSFKQILQESAEIDAAKKRLQKMKKGSSVSFTSAKTGQKVSGAYHGLKRMGAHSYAHVEEPGKGAHMVPVHHIH
jgi:hypothetical protein